MRWPPRNECLNAAKTKKKRNKKTGRMAQHFKCSSCKKDFPRKEVVVDHIDPVVDVKVGFVSFEIYIERMFCSIEGFQILCESCHKDKCDDERVIRKGKK